MTSKVFKAAFASSLPVLMGYTTMGAAAGILLVRQGHLATPSFWGLLTSATSISGALQFICVDWARNHTPLLQVAFLTFCLNIRYAMYGLSLLERLQNIPLWKKLYLIWSLTDETYALEVENKTPSGESSLDYCLLVAGLDHLYWIAGVVAGTLLGKSLPFNTKGIDFAMTALFLVILTDQCREKSNRIPAAIGLFCALIAKLLFPVEKMIIPAMLLMLGTFLLFRNSLDKQESQPNA
ncbi:MAG: AzlC family ABC transporter permease [Victivallales bacterium]|nr:AzlC family ABC transporter permease [Victivallales bacterium]